MLANPADARPTSNGKGASVSLRVLRFAVVSSVALWASRGLGEEAPAGAGAETAPSVTPPRLIRAEPAIVPEGEAWTTAVAVTLALTVDENGHVSEATIVESGGERFDHSALDAVTRFEFEPARRGERPLAAKIRYRYVFPASTP